VEQLHSEGKKGKLQACCSWKPFAWESLEASQLAAGLLCGCLRGNIWPSLVGPQLEIAKYWNIGSHWPSPDHSEWISAEAEVWPLGLVVEVVGQSSVGLQTLPIFYVVSLIELFPVSAARLLHFMWNKMLRIKSQVMTIRDQYYNP
jgi:hypothetical protein